MPRVSDAYRQARRDQIVEAALRVLERRTLHELTMADVISESGLSAGSVYSHLTGKAELVALVADRIVGQRLETLNAPDEPVRSPQEVVRWWLRGVRGAGAPFASVVQVWGDAATDPAMREVVLGRVGAVEDGFRQAARRWLDATGRDADADDVARTMVTFCQGFVMRSALLGPQDVDASMRALDLLVAD